MINPIYRFFFKGENLFQSFGSVTDQALDGTGALYSTVGFTTSRFIPIPKSDKILVSADYATALYDADQNFLVFSGAGTADAHAFENVPLARYIRISMPTLDFANTQIISFKRVYPIYKDDVAKEYELENNQRFYRTKMSGKFNFVRQDYDYLSAQPFETEFLFDIEISYDMGQTWQNYYEGKFMKTDCKWDDDDKQCEVTPDPVDEYTDVLAGLEKEYDLIKLAPKIEQLVLQRRPVIQIYIPGDSVVSCFLGGTYWEQDANAISDENALINTYYFALCNLLKEINLTVTGTHAAASGLYTGRMSITTSGSEKYMQGTLINRENPAYRLDVLQQILMPTWFTINALSCSLVRVSDGAVLFKFEQSSMSEKYDNLDFNMPAQSGVTGTCNAEMATYRIYARYLLDVDSIQGLTTYNIPGDDIVENNRNYRKVIGYAIDVAFISANFSDTPTEWGLADNDKYFRPPYSIFGQKFFPIARSTWRYASIWFGFSAFDWILEEAGRKRYLLRDTFPVSACIKVLLQQFAPNITHEETPEYSEFFYGTTQYTPLYTPKMKLLITQKTNLLVGNYDQPAQKAPTTLQQFTNMLRDCFRCFWFIDNGKFRIEHISWFRNGGTYTGLPQIGTDLTQIENIRNGKKWGYHSSSWEFDKADLAERYQFAWMDDVTPSFEGVPIQVKSKYVQAGKIEDVNVSNFTTDVDYLLLNPGDISKDGFALFGAVSGNALETPDTGFSGSSANNGESTPKYALKPEFLGRPAVAKFNAYSTGVSCWIIFYNGNDVISQQSNFSIDPLITNYTIDVTIPINATHVGFVVFIGAADFVFYDLDVPSLSELPFVTRSADGVDFIMQNGYMSWITLQPNFYVYDLPASQVEINGETAFAQGIERKKKQTVSFPSLQDIDPMKLIKTYIGDGQIDKISVNLHSRMNKITVKYDTE